MRERADVSLVGNHDLASLGRVDIDLFNYDAAAAARWTQTVLDDEARAYLEGWRRVPRPSRRSCSTRAPGSRLGLRAR